jgi:hypothetical protein
MSAPPTATARGGSSELSGEKNSSRSFVTLSGVVIGGKFLFRSAAALANGGDFYRRVADIRTEDVRRL